MLYLSRPCLPSRRNRVLNDLRRPFSRNRTVVQDESFGCCPDIEMVCVEPGMSGTLIKIVSPPTLRLVWPTLHLSCLLAPSRLCEESPFAALSGPMKPGNPTPSRREETRTEAARVDAKAAGNKRPALLTRSRLVRMSSNKPTESCCLLSDDFLAANLLLPQIPRCGRVGKLQLPSRALVPDRPRHRHLRDQDECSWCRDINCSSVKRVSWHKRGLLGIEAE